MLWHQAERQQFKGFSPFFKNSSSALTKCSYGLPEESVDCHLVVSLKRQRSQAMQRKTLLPNT